MAAQGEIKSLQQRTEGFNASPVPVFTIPALPEKIARLDPAGARDWVARCNATFAEWAKKMNTVNSGIASAIKP